MSVDERREREFLKKRQAILNAARKLFAKDKYENVSLRAIARHAGYSPAALYRYFRDKREILSALRHEGFSEFLEVQRKYMRTDDPAEAIKISGRSYLKFAAEQPEYYYLMFGTGCEEVDHEGRWAERANESWALFREKVSRLVATGKYGDVDVETMMYTLWATVHGFADLIHIGKVKHHDPDVDLDRIIDTVLHFMVRTTPDYVMRKGE